MAELLGGTPPVDTKVRKPRAWSVITSGVIALTISLLVPRVASIAATAWMIFVASKTDIRIKGGGTPPISSRELTEWAAFLQLEPHGEERADLRAGIIASTIANANKKKGTSPFKPEDFMPKFEPQEEQTVEQQMAIAKEMSMLSQGGE